MMQFSDFHSFEVAGLGKNATAIECVVSVGSSKESATDNTIPSPPDMAAGGRLHVSSHSVCDAAETALPFARYIWPRNTEPRFRNLVAKAALETATADEKSELSALTVFRRAERNVRPLEQILWEDRQQRLTENLLKALRELIDFNEEASHTQRGKPQ